MNDIENQIQYTAFIEKFCALWKIKDNQNKIGHSRDIGNLSCGNVEKTTFLDKIVINKQNMFLKALFYAESEYEINFCKKWLV